MEASNREYAKTNGDFRAACVAVGIPATKRQASKFRRKIGLAYWMGKKGKRHAV